MRKVRNINFSPAKASFSNLRTISLYRVSILLKDSANEETRGPSGPKLLTRVVSVESWPCPW